jgi:acetoin utilization deacetylase AcuC-like enzyme
VFLSPSTYGAAITCVSGVVEAVRRACAPASSPVALAISRPPGHHACCNAASGFCFLNNVAVAARQALHLGWAGRVVILDWDIHHGNGTQDLT